MMGFGQMFGRRKSSFYGSPQAMQQRIISKKRQIEKLTRDIQRLEHDLRRASSAPTPPTSPVRPPTLTEAQKEARYLAKYKDVGAAVKGGTFKTGRQHWQQYGRKEGRVFDGLQRPGFIAGFGGWWVK